ncbi:MAG: alpha/beta hydrolase [bacterium]|nr:alpha/beta hydrolase [bacterium]
MNESTIPVGDGIELAITEAGEGPAVLLVHGWPETKHSWRHQLPALAAAGYRAVALDCRGYGGSSKPDASDAYGLTSVVEDVIGLIDAADLGTPVLVGHDWGSIIMWTAAVMHPDRFRALASLNVPYRGWCVGFPTIDYMREHLADRFGYVIAFQEVGRTEASFEKDPDGFLQRVYGSIATDSGFMSDADFGTYRDAFVAGGMAPPLNYYRNIDANHAALASFENAEIQLPTLMVTADSDPVLPASLADGMERWIPELTVEHVTGSGHWTQQEQPEQVNAALIRFLDGLG